MKFPIEGFICLYVSNLQPVGLDYDSGGYDYDYEAKALSEIKIWNNVDDANKYANTINWKHKRNPKVPPILVVVKARFDLTIEMVAKEK